MHRYRRYGTYGTYRRYGSTYRTVGTYGTYGSTYRTVGTVGTVPQVRELTNVSEDDPTKVFMDIHIWARSVAHEAYHLPVSYGTYSDHDCAMILQRLCYSFQSETGPSPLRTRLGVL